MLVRRVVDYYISRTKAEFPLAAAAVVVVALVNVVVVVAAGACQDQTR